MRAMAEMVLCDDIIRTGCNVPASPDPPYGRGADSGAVGSSSLGLVDTANIPKIIRKPFPSPYIQY